MICVIGDPHAQNKTLEELSKLLDFVKTQNPEHIVFLGDLFHTHGTIKADILHFWEEKLKDLSKNFKVWVLKGNHDGPHDKAIFHDMGPLNILSKINMENVNFILSPKVQEIYGKRVLFMPYFFDESSFINEAKKQLGNIKADFIFCHQTFNGATYENGFYAPEGFSVENVKTLLNEGGRVISGHIHLKQSFDVIDYVGSPLWLINTDANSDKFLLFLNKNFEYQWFDVSILIPPLKSLNIKNFEEVEDFLEKNKDKDLKKTILNIYCEEKDISKFKSVLDKTDVNYRIIPAVQKSENKTLDARKISLEEWVLKRSKISNKNKIIQILNSLK